MEKIYIGFSKRANNLFSRAIELAEGTKYSHVYIRRKSKYGEYVYQASSLQVNFMNIKTFIEESIIVEEYEFNIPDNDKIKLLKFFIKYVGRKYSILEIFQISLILLAKKFGINLKFKGDGNKTFICSELGALFCTVFLNINIKETKDFILPVELHKYIVKNGKRVI